MTERAGALAANRPASHFVKPLFLIFDGKEERAAMVGFFAGTYCLRLGSAHRRLICDRQLHHVGRHHFVDLPVIVVRRSFEPPIVGPVQLLLFGKAVGGQRAPVDEILLARLLQFGGSQKVRILY